MALSEIFREVIIKNNKIVSFINMQSHIMILWCLTGGYLMSITMNSNCGALGCCNPEVVGSSLACDQNLVVPGHNLVCVVPWALIICSRWECMLQSRD